MILDGRDFFFFARPWLLLFHPYCLFHFASLAPFLFSTLSPPVCPAFSSPCCSSPSPLPCSWLLLGLVCFPFSFPLPFVVPLRMRLLFFLFFYSLSAVMLHAPSVPSGPLVAIFSLVGTLQCFGARTQAPISYVCTYSTFVLDARSTSPFWPMLARFFGFVGARTQAPITHIRTLLFFAAHTEAPISYVRTLLCVEACT